MSKKTINTAPQQRKATEWTGWDCNGQSTQGAGCGHFIQSSPTYLHREACRVIMCGITVLLSPSTSVCCDVMIVLCIVDGVRARPRNLAGSCRKEDHPRW